MQASRLTISLCFALSVFQTALAQPTASSDATLRAVVITATSREQPIQDVQASVQVISAKDLEAYAGTSVTEALKLATGVDARANGTSAFVAMRGLISNAGSPVLILVDGLRRTGKYGTSGLNLLSTEDVERIEIVRGPMSALYGADATGGVINVITKAPQPGQVKRGSTRLTLGAVQGGDRGTAIAGATLYVGTQGAGHRFSVEQRQRDLFRYPGTAMTTYDLSKIDETYLNYEGVVQLVPGQQLRWLLESVDQDDMGPGRTARAPITDFTTHEREERYTAALRYTGAVGQGALSVDLSHGNSKASTTRSFPTIETTDYDQTQLDARYALDLGQHTLVVGAGQRDEDLNVSIVAQVARTTNQHVLLQDEWRLAPAWRLLAGLRWDDFSTFGSATTPRVSLGYSPGPWSFRVGYGEAYRAPSALEQYARFTRGRSLILGQADIQPETNKAWELVAGYSASSWSGEWVLFDSRVTNLIQTVNRAALPGDPVGVTTRAVYTNIGKARLRGSELGTTWQLNPRWSITGGWDYLDATDGQTGARLIQRARHTLRAGARYEQGSWRLDVQGRYLRDYYASVAVTPPAVTPPPTNSNFGTLDVKLGYQVSPAWSLALGVDNLNNRRQPANYSATGSVQDPPARFWYATTTYRF
ncbi:MAG: TonB-dependent receptor [Hydrogenophaga sp.]|uniref:TonB-dependent receptor plug domain-containing protein n=1 Tax=Hydrogenophaga sp. TaxID=1904254 RepID=UPI002614CA1B|nr:TonB-dependent receptor [Hydrogenophaga sp.]MDM7941403.1 TonB-dependent receptor [Hydrogenophaga sp.]